LSLLYGLGVLVCLALLSSPSCVLLTVTRIRGSKAGFCVCLFVCLFLCLSVCVTQHSVCLCLFVVYSRCSSPEQEGAARPGLCRVVRSLSCVCLCFVVWFVSSPRCVVREPPHICFAFCFLFIVLVWFRLLWAGFVCFVFVSFARGNRSSLAFRFLSFGCGLFVSLCAQGLCFVFFSCLCTCTHPFCLCVLRTQQKSNVCVCCVFVSFRLLAFLLACVWFLCPRQRKRKQTTTTTTTTKTGVTSRSLFKATGAAHPSIQIALRHHRPQRSVAVGLFVCLFVCVCVL